LPKKFRSEPSNPQLEHQPEPLPFRKSTVLRYALWAAAAIYVIASLYLIHDMRTDIYRMRTKILVLQQKQWFLNAQQAELGRPRPLNSSRS